MSESKNRPRSAWMLPGQLSIQELAGRCRRAAWGLALAAGLQGPAAAGVTLTDDTGVAVRFDAPPARIVSLLPSLTESVCALGACHRLVGVDRYSNHPAPVRAVPRMGGGLDPSLEAVLAQRPDVVLMATSARGADSLRRLGLKVLSLEPRSLADVERTLGLLEALLAVPEAGRAWRDLQAEVGRAAQALPPGARGTRVYFEAAGGGYAAGPGSFVGELMARLGLVNVVPDGQGPYPRLNPEWVVRANPQVVLVARRGLDSLAQRPGWSGLEALRTGRVCAFTQDEADVLVRAGPRVAEAMRLLVRCLADKAPAGRAGR